MGTMGNAMGTVTVEVSKVCLPRTLRTHTAVHNSTSDLTMVRIVRKACDDSKLLVSLWVDESIVGIAERKS